MTKYVGKHRKPPKWNSTKTISVTIATAGFLAIPSTPCLAEKVIHDKPPLPPFTVGFAPPNKAPLTIPKPAPIEDVVEEVYEWIDSEPEPEVTTIQAECQLGPGSNLGLSVDADLVYRTVCALFPEITTFYGFRAGDQDHGTGNAIDCMVYDDTAIGNQLAAFLITNAEDLNIKYVIWQQRIWMPGQGWSGMEDRGSPTANHYDHVHVSVY